MKSEIVIIVGCPGSGKSTFAQKYVDDEYYRLNRDELGGSVDGLLPRLKALWQQGKRLFVLDNTYATAESRQPVINLAKELNVDIGCVVMMTSIEDCQFNVCSRIAKKYPLIPDGNKHKDPQVVPPVVLFSYRKNFKLPATADGFSWIKFEQFNRIEAPYTNKALILDADGTLRKTISGDKYPKSVDDIQVLPNRVKKIKEYQDQGYKLLGVSNQSGVAKGEFSAKVCSDMLEQTNKLLGLDIEWKFCPHGSFPSNCWCRKPQVGMGVEFIEKHQLNRKVCIMVGDMTSDRTFAERCGFKYFDQQAFFGNG